MGRFDAPNSPCGSVRRFPNSSPPNLDVAYAWAPPNDEMFSGSGVNPIVNYQMNFNPVSRIPDTSSTSPVEYSMATLCPGAEIGIFARPESRPAVEKGAEPPRRAVRFRTGGPSPSFGWSGLPRSMKGQRHSTLHRTGRVIKHRFKDERCEIQGRDDNHLRGRPFLLGL
jgi:hypothetical protein